MCFSILVFAIGISQSFFVKDMFFQGPIWRSKCPYPPHGCKMRHFGQSHWEPFLEGRLCFFLNFRKRKLFFAAILIPFLPVDFENFWVQLVTLAFICQVRLKVVPAIPRSVSLPSLVS